MPPAWGADVYVHPKGDDAADGSAAHPFRRVARAQRAARALIAAGMDENVVVHIAAGDYVLAEPLRFDERDSGRDGHRVIYRGDGDSLPRLIGGRVLTGWEPYRGSIYRVRAPLSSPAPLLVENGQMGVVARTPNAGYLTVARANSDSRVLGYRAGELPASFTVDGSSVVVWSGFHEHWDGGKNYDWYATLTPIQSVDFASHSIMLANRTHRELHSRNRYFVRGAVEFLDQPGEYCLAPDGFLYYRPRRTPIERRRIVVSDLPRVLDIRGSSRQQLVHDLSFQRLDISCSASFPAEGPGAYQHSREGLVYLENARAIELNGCRIHHAGWNGVALSGMNLEHTVRDCLIEDTGYAGIRVSGFSVHWQGQFPDEVAAYLNHGHHITNNYIRRVGRIIGHGSCVLINAAGDIGIDHNLIEDSPRFGIRGYDINMQTLTDPQGPFKGRAFGKAVTWDNHWDFIFLRRLRIIGNEVRAVMQDSQDGGAITFWGTGRDNLVADNLVYEVQSNLPAASVAGIYLDDNSDDFTVTRNLVTGVGGCKYTYPLIIKGRENVVTNNVVADNQAWAAVYVLQTGGYTEPVEAHAYRRNIFANNSSAVVWQIHPWHERVLAQCDFNLFWNPEGAYEVRLRWNRNRPWDFWRQQHGGKYDAHSVQADPQFIDPVHLDYRVRPGSPALRLGFRSFSVQDSGPAAGFPFAAEVRAADRRFPRRRRPWPREDAS